VVSSWSSHTPCVGSLFSWYPSCLVWSRRGLLTCLAWAHCSHGIDHAWHGLVAVFSHALHGLLVLIRGGGHSAGSRVEIGRSVERDNMRLRSIALYTTGNMHSSSPYHIRKKLRNYSCTSVRTTCVGSFASICSSGKDSESYRSNHPLTEARKARKARKATDAPPILPTQPPTLPTQPPPYGN